MYPGLVLALICGLSFAYGNPGGNAMSDFEKTLNVSLSEATRAAEDIMTYVDNGETYDGERKRAPMGGIGKSPDQIRHYVAKALKVALKKKTNTCWFCEVGFGSGQSTAVLLATHPHIKVLSFDLFPDPIRRATGSMGSWSQNTLFLQQRDAISYISLHWPLRADRIAGNSNETVRTFAAMNPGFKCDILSVDGWHGSPEVYYDIKHMGQLALPGSILFIDDMERPPLRADLQHAADEGLVAQPTCGSAGGKTRKTKKPHEFCWSRYL